MGSCINIIKYRYVQIALPLFKVFFINIFLLMFHFLYLVHDNRSVVIGDLSFWWWISSRDRPLSHNIGLMIIMDFTLIQNIIWTCCDLLVSSRCFAPPWNSDGSQRLSGATSRRESNPAFMIQKASVLPIWLPLCSIRHVN